MNNISIDKHKQKIIKMINNCENQDDLYKISDITDEWGE